jgi:hypothetical protein
MVSPCISVLRRLSTTITKVLGSDQGTKHQPADLQNDIALLMASLHEHDLYRIKGRVFAKDDGSPTPDVILVGAQQLTDSSSNPLTEYNTMFKRLQSRRRMQPLVGSWSESAPAAEFPPHTNASVPLTDIPAVQDLVSEKVSGDIAVASGSNSDEEEDENSDIDSDLDDGPAAEQVSAFERVLDEDDGPTLTRDTAADVALDMDGGDNGFLPGEDSEDPYLDDGAIDNSDDDYVDE